jgi:hypothetical protein
VDHALPLLLGGLERVGFIGLAAQPGTGRKRPSIVTRHKATHLLGALVPGLPDRKTLAVR